MEESEIKILQAKEKLRKDISSDENMIDYYTKDKAKSILKELAKCDRNDEQVTLDKKLFEDLYYFLRDFSDSKYDNMHEYIGKYIQSRNIRQEILKSL